VPYWDYDAPGQPDAVRDSSAASTAASGLLDLATYDPNPHQGQLYHRWALRILHSLAGSFTTRGLPDQDGILHHATRSVPLDSGIDGALIYGDYYFMEALVKATRPEVWRRMAGRADA
jgi:unsaturated chondroitin disaccharide hydrolase